jgi:GTP-binding protein
LQISDLKQICNLQSIGNLKSEICNLTLRISAEFVTSAAGVSGLPGDDLSEIALVGRSNVGKSSLINALTRQRLARTSARPGKTRLANVYRVARGNARPLYLVDLPGYGYARGGAGAARELEELTRGYFGRDRSARGHAEAAAKQSRGEASALVRAGGGAPAPVKNVDGDEGEGEIRLKPDPTSEGAASEGAISALLLVDARHPGIDSDRDAWNWLKETVAEPAIVATKIDKLARSQRIRALRELESVFEHSVLPVSAVTGEGLDELWNLIDRLANSPNPQPRRSRSRNNRPRATAPRPPKK